MRQDTKNITIPKAVIQKKDGIAILPLSEYERMKEDLEMARSKNLAQEIAKARKEIKQGKVIPLEEVEKRLGL